MKPNEQFFPVRLFIALYKVVLTFSLRLKSKRVLIQIKATEEYFPLEDGSFLMYEEKLKRSMIELDDSFFLVNNSN